MFRTLLTGLGATLVDIAILALCIRLLAFDPRIASIPALLAGALFQFYGNRYFAFQSRSACIRRQALWFSLAEVVTLGLNLLLYDILVVRLQESPIAPEVIRAISTGVVFMAWSYPVWTLVFRNKEDK